MFKPNTVGRRPLNTALGSHGKSVEMLSVLFSGAVRVCYGQIYVVCPGCSEVLLENSFKGQRNGLCGAGVPGGLMLMCGLHTGAVSLEVSMHEREPPVEPSWGEVVEAPYTFVAQPVVVESWEGDTICQLPIDGPGFMVRWSARRFGEAEDSGHADDVEPYEEYILQLWRSSTPTERVLKVSSEKAAYWHKHAQSL